MRLPDPTEKTVLIPVRFTDKGWKLLSGGDVPALKAGSIADLIVPQSALMDKADAKAFTDESMVSILPKDSKLWALISKKHGVTGPDDSKLKDIPTKPADIEGQFYVGFSLKEELRLRLRGTKSANLETCGCELPGFSPDVEAESINQAYTRLSEKYEPLRKSHSGNVFQKVWYESKANGKLLPLDVLRKAAVALKGLG